MAVPRLQLTGITKAYPGVVANSDVGLTVMPGEIHAVLGWLGPLIVMMTQGNKSPRVRAAAVEALNFQITVAIGFIISYILMGAVIGVVLLPLVGLASLIFSIMGAMAENQNRPYTYPFSIKIVKK